MVNRVFLIVIICLSTSSTTSAGPPFRTDDPEPVEYQHWEVYLASQGSYDNNGHSLTAPHFEVNYGVLPDVQLHLLTPFESVNPEGQHSHYGYGDTELGVKFKFIQETDSRPQLGVFPIVLIPTGDKEQGLGSGETQTFLPVWIQKSWGPWKTYGGGGYWINPGTDNKDYWFFGWTVQRDMTKYLTLGTEIFHQTRSTVEGDSSTGYNVGAIINFSELHHLLLSAGSDISGPNTFSVYAGYQLTF